MKVINTWVWILIATATAIIGHHIHGGWFWTALNFIFAPVAWVKWLICHEVSVSVIKGAFAFFLR